MGIVTDRRDDWIMVKADGDGEAVRYLIPAVDNERVLRDLQGIFTVSRVRLVYRTEGDSRRLVSIEKQPAKASGTVTGRVLENHAWWIEVKPAAGPAEGYAVHFPFDRNREVMQALEGLKPGDIVTIRFTTDSERHRIESIRRRAGGAR